MLTQEEVGWYTEAERRGVLKPEEAEWFNEAKRRGLTGEKVAQDQPKEKPGLMDRLRSLAEPGDPNNPTIPGLVRAAQDFRERGLQMSTGGAPGEVYGPNAQPFMGATPKAAQAAMLYKQALNRELTPDELARIEAEPDVAFENARQLANRGAAAERRGFDKQAEWHDSMARVAGNIAPAVALRAPGALANAPGAAGVVGRTACNFGAGAGLGATEFVQPGQSRAENALLGGAVQAGVGAVGEGIAALSPKQMLAREMQLKEALDSPEARKGLSKYGLSMPFSQITGNAAVAGAESQVARFPKGATLVQEQNRRLATETGREFAKVFENINPNNISRLGTSQRLATAFTKHFDAVDEQADDIFKGSFSELKRVTGDKPIIDTDGVKKVLDAKIAELKNLTIVSDDAAAELKALQKYRNKFGTTFSKNMNATTLQRLLHEQSAESAGAGRMMTDLATEKDRLVAGMVKGALLDDMSAAADRLSSVGNTQAAGALNKFKQAREDYGLLKEYQREMKTRTFSRIFDKNAPPTPEEAYGAFQRLPPTDKKYWLNTLSKFDPELKGGVQRAYFRDLFEKSKRAAGSPAGDYPIDMKRLAENWKIDENFKAMFDGPAQRDLIKIRARLSRISDELPVVGGGQSLIGGQKEGARVLAGAAQGTGQSAIFGTGFVLQKFLPQHYARWLFTADGRQALLKALSPNSYSPSEVAAAVGYLNRTANEPEEDQPVQ